ADSLILVTDGFSDEDIMPLVQSRVPVTSVRRVIVKHSESIEETAALFSKYWKMLIEDPRYSRIALGLPGVLLISLGILVLLQVFISFDIYVWTAIVGLIILGSYLLGKGYGIDRKISAFLSRPYRYSISDLVVGFSSTFGFILVAIGFYQAWSFVSASFGISFRIPLNIDEFMKAFPLVVGWFINKSMTLAVIGLCTIFLGRSVAYLLERDPHFWRTAALVAVFAWLWMILNEISQIIINPALPPDSLVLSIITGIAVIVASGLTTHILSRKYRKFFERETVVEGEDEGGNGRDEESS
ncbi:MAG: putative membrane protein, partial [Candidatus Bathyarchaeota archaeon B63]